MIPRVILYNPQAEHWTMPVALLSLASSFDRDQLDPVIIDGMLEDDPIEDWAKFDYVGTAGFWVPENIRRLVAPHTLHGDTG